MDQEKAGRTRAAGSTVVGLLVGFLLGGFFVVGCTWYLLHPSFGTIAGCPIPDDGRALIVLVARHGDELDTKCYTPQLRAPHAKSAD